MSITLAPDAPTDGPSQLEYIGSGFLSIITLGFIPMSPTASNVNDKINAQADAALAAIAAFSEWKYLTIILGDWKSLLSSVRCHLNAFQCLGRRMAQVILILGHTSDSALSHMQYYKLVARPKEIIELENMLKSGLRMFKVFTQSNYLDFVLLGKESEGLFQKFDGLLKQTSDAIMKQFNGIRSPFALTESPAYRVVCNIKSMVDAEALSITTATIPSALAEIASFVPIDPQILLARLLEMQREASFLVTDRPADLILHTPSRKFWISQFGTLQCVLITRFCDSFEMVANEGTLPAEFIARLANDLMTVLNANNTFEENYIDFVYFSKLVRCVPDDMTDICDVVQHILGRLQGDNHTLRLAPPAPQCRILWADDNQYANFTEAINKPGWLMVTGPSGSGVSTHLLAAGHALGPVRDFLYVNCGKVTGDSELISRVVLQLSMATCKTRDEFITVFSALLMQLKPNSLIVLDNFEEFSTTEGAGALVMTVCNNFASKFCLVVGCKSHTLENNCSTFQFGEMPLPVLQELAVQMYALDPDALLTASRGVVGDLVNLATFCDLQFIRKIAQEVMMTEDKSVESRAQTIYQTSICRDLTADESLIACCLLRGNGFFDVSLSWSLCKVSFQGDIVRWFVAWNGLLNAGWLLRDRELGYYVPSKALVTGTIPGRPELAKQMNAYASHYARQLCRLHEEAKQCRSTFVYFDHARHHFRHLLSVFFRYHNNADPSGIEHDAAALIRMVAGRMNLCYTVRFAPSGALHIAKTVLECFKKHIARREHGLESSHGYDAVTQMNSEETIVMLRAATDVAELLHICNCPEEGITLLQPLTDANAEMYLRYSEDYGRAFNAVGVSYEAFGKTRAARTALEQVVFLAQTNLQSSINSTASVIEDKQRALAIAQSKLDQLTATKQGGCCIMQ